MRNMMFATVYPYYHPKKGQPTHFVEKICAGLADKGILAGDPFWKGLQCDFHQYYNGVPKWHTIRAGNRWTVGDYFKPLIWSGKPYRSKTIQIANPIMVEKTWEFIIDNGDYWMNGSSVSARQIILIARNDGLSVPDLMDWVAPYGKKEPAECQIICWNKSIDYFSTTGKP